MGIFNADVGIIAGVTELELSGVIQVTIFIKFY